MSVANVLVAMSGGVDSSVAAALLVDAGYDVVGVTMKMHDTPEARGAKAGCCTVEDADDARAVAGRLGIPYYVVDLSEPFGAHVVDRFVDEYARGRTPNPCVECNRHIKFDALVGRADLLGADHIATGHHARMVGGRIVRGRDRDKDQSYVLACMDRSVLERVLLPIGELSKTDVRAIASEIGLRTAAKPESMEVCFLGAGGKDEFLRRRVPLDAGAVVDDAGAEIGRHDGAALYTIGQRRGLRVATGERRYVQSVDVERNVVHTARHQPRVRHIMCTAPTWHVADPATLEGAEISVQTSAHGAAHPARVRVAGADPRDLIVDFPEDVPAPAPGQLAAFYEGDIVAGAATITSLG